MSSEARRSANRNYVARHPDRVRAQQSANYLKNADKRKADARRRRRDKPETVKAYRERNKEKIAAAKRVWRAANKDKNRQYDLKKNYGLTVVEYDAMLSAQAGTCAICRRKPGRRRLHVDHAHSTGQIRGLLCSHCNTALGLLRESTELLTSAISYLAAYGAKHE